ncbi:cell surface protein, partial [Campylobacter fetus]|nr:cell surface protein [Campylobacter fetus]
SESNDQVTLKLLAATTKVKVDGDLGDGNDTFVFKDAAKVTAVTDDNSVQSSVIKNFAVGDKIKFDSFVAENKLVVVTSNVDDASATELKTKFADAKITAVDGLDTVADGDIFAYVNGTDTYVVYNKVGGTADELDADDIVVKLAGVKVGTDFNLQLIDGELHAVAIA